jgi:hypothetical protein
MEDPSETRRKIKERILATLPKEPYTFEELDRVARPKTEKEKAFFRTWGFLPTWRDVNDL